MVATTPEFVQLRHDRSQTQRVWDTVDSSVSSRSQHFFVDITCCIRQPHPFLARLSLACTTSTFAHITVVGAGVGEIQKIVGQNILGFTGLAPHGNGYLGNPISSSLTIPLIFTFVFLCQRGDFVTLYLHLSLHFGWGVHNFVVEEQGLSQDLRLSCGDGR